MFTLPYKSVKNPLSLDEFEDQKGEAKNIQDNQNDSKNPNTKYSNLRTIFPVILVLIALPLVIGASLQKQNVSQQASSLDCNSDKLCTECITTPNSCSFGNGKQTCTFTKRINSQTCNPVTFKNEVCYKPNCENGFTCLKQICVNDVLITPSLFPTP